MQSIFLFAMYCTFFIVATQAPFVLALGYVWIDLFRPQIVNPGIMGMFPLSMIMGGAAILSYFMADRRNPPKVNAMFVLMVLFAIWMVINTYFIALLPFDAQGKHDWAFKTVVFSTFLPFFFRSRIQIEALILVVLGASAGNAIAFAAKVAVGGSFYGQALGLSRTDMGFGESSTFSMVCAALVPLVLFVMRHSLIIPRFPFRDLVHIGGCFGLVLALLGTHARTGLVALAALAGLLWWEAKRKIAIAGAMAGGALLVLPVLLPFFGEQWLARMDTILNPSQEGSAMGRIAIWRWTWDFVQSHPLGGGFEVYRLSRYSMTLADGTPYSIAGKAFHSIYFEVLGELGFPGLAMLMAMFIVTFFNLYRIKRQTRDDPDLRWLHDLARAVIMSLIVYMVGGAFVGIAFQAPHYIMMSLTVSMVAWLANYRAQLTAPRVAGVAGWARPSTDVGGVPVGAGGLARGGGRAR